MDQANSSLSNAGLPKMSDVYGNLNYPTSVNDIGGSAATAATGINKGTTNAFQQYQAGASALPKAMDTYNTLEQQNGIPQMKQTAGSLMGDVNNLQQTINRVEPNVNQNTANSLVTNSQREGMVAAQKYPLEQQLTPEMNSLATIESQIGNAQTGVTDALGAQNTQNAQNLQVGAMGVSVAQDNAARQMTGFTTDQENTMTMLLKKLDTQKALDDQEWQTLSTLAENKQGYQNELAKISASQKYQTLGGGQNLVNTQTNQAVNPSMLTSRTGLANNI